MLEVKSSFRLNTSPVYPRDLQRIQEQVERRLFDVQEKLKYFEDKEIKGMRQNN